MRNVHLGLQALGGEFMLGELFAIDKGQGQSQGLALGLLGAQQRDDGR